MLHTVFTHVLHTHTHTHIYIPHTCKPYTLKHNIHMPRTSQTHSNYNVHTPHTYTHLHTQTHSNTLPHTLHAHVYIHTSPYCTCRSHTAHPPQHSQTETCSPSSFAPSPQRPSQTVPALPSCNNITGQKWPHCTRPETSSPWLVRPYSIFHLPSLELLTLYHREAAALYSWHILYEI